MFGYCQKLGRGSWGRGFHTKRPKTWDSHLQAAASIWRWPNTWRGRISCEPTTWAFMPSACSKNLVPHLQVFGQGQQACLARQVFGDGQTSWQGGLSCWEWGQPLGPSRQALAPNTWFPISKSFGISKFLAGGQQLCLARQVFGYCQKLGRGRLNSWGRGIHNKRLLQRLGFPISKFLAAAQQHCLLLLVFGDGQILGEAG